jgi:hypothetical protein
MYIICISNLRKKIFLFTVLAAFWVSVILLSGSFVNKRISFDVTINNFVKFSCPLSLKIKEVFISEVIENCSVETNSSQLNPLLQKFSNYKSLEGKFSFSYPSIFNIEEKSFSGGEVLYHIDLLSKSTLSHGFVQVWSLKEPLAQFLEHSKQASSQNIQNFKSEKSIVNGMPGFIWNYVIKGTNGILYNASEAFFEKSGKMYRISYFVPVNEWNKVHEDIFNKMVKSLKVL